MRRAFGARTEPVLCLYCETELKPFRGFFDEDFCCGDHREKYFSSFRKAVAGIDVLEKTTAFQAKTRVDSAPAADPRAADFLPISVPLCTVETSQHGCEAAAVSARQELAIPNRRIAWGAALEAEDRPADLAGSIDRPVAALQPELSPIVVSDQRLAADLETAPPALETACPAIEDGPVPGFQKIWSHAEPLPPALEKCSLPSFPAATSPAALSPSEEFAGFTLFCAELAGTPVAAREIAPLQKISTPVLTPVRETIPGEEGPATPDPDEPYWGELYNEPAPAGTDFGPALSVAPEIAPSLAMSSAHRDSPALAPAAHSSLDMMPHHLELISVPPSSPDSVSHPGVAPEFASAMADSHAADSAAGPHSHAPLRLSFGSLVRIKNWRLRITFAKPA